MLLPTCLCPLRLRTRSVSRICRGYPFSGRCTCRSIDAPMAYRSSEIFMTPPTTLRDAMMERWWMRIATTIQIGIQRKILHHASGSLSVSERETRNDGRKTEQCYSFLLSVLSFYWKEYVKSQKINSVEWIFLAVLITHVEYKIMFNLFFYE